MFRYHTVLPTDRTSAYLLFIGLHLKPSKSFYHHLFILCHIIHEGIYKQLKSLLCFLFGYSAFFCILSVNSFFNTAILFLLYFYFLTENPLLFRYSIASFKSSPLFTVSSMVSSHTWGLWSVSMPPCLPSFAHFAT